MKHKPYRFLIYLCIRVVMRCVSIMPRSFALWLAKNSGLLTYHLLPRYREKTLKHLKTAFKTEKTERELSDIARNVFINLALTGVDWLFWPRTSKEERAKWVRFDEKDIAKFRKAAEDEKGVIGLTAHLGNWELAGAFLRDQGFNVAALGRRIYYPPFNKILVNLRLSWGLRTIYRDDPPKEILRVLHQKECIGMLADQDIDSVDGVFTPFFGRPAFTPIAPVRLALASGAPIVPTFLVREGSSYRFLVKDAIRVKPLASRQETIQVFTQKWSTVFEEVIRRYPDQWVWMHDRWKTQPAKFSEEMTMAREA